MFINKIKDFLPSYDNFSKEKFEQIIKISNLHWFNPLKLEKDFILTLILIKFSLSFPELIFKWWTCLNKVYFPYFRLSEDLDFVLVDPGLWRKYRQKVLKEYEKKFIEVFWKLWLELTEKNKQNEHRLATFNFTYVSILDNSKQNIKIDISFKDKLYLNYQFWTIKSIFIDPVFEEKIFADHKIKTMNLREMVAEKIRACLTRSQPAIRDFFDIRYIKHNSNFDFSDNQFLDLVKIKLKEVNYKYSLENNYDNLKKQIETDLNPVLHNDISFDFEEIYNFVLTFKV